MEVDLEEMILLEQFLTTLPREMSDLVTANLKRAQVKQEQTCDKPLEVGDDILVLNPVRQSKPKVALALLVYSA